MRKLGKLTTGYVPRSGFVNEKSVPFKEVLPISRLRNIVSGKGDKSSKAVCIQEMSVLFACLKKHDFKEAACAEEVSKFQSCYSNYQKETEAKQVQDKKGLLTPGEKKFSQKQANALLKRFPS